MIGGPIKRHLVDQFRRAAGALGWLAGRVMAERRSNRARNLWTLDLADIQPGDRVLEIGFGPGFALQEVCRRLDRGRAVGLDHSAAMLQMASKRNRDAISSGKLSLLLGAAEGLAGHSAPALNEHFDCIYAVNVVFFWDEPQPVLAALAARLAPEGALFLTFQPRLQGNFDLERLANQWTQLMDSAGLLALGYEAFTAITPPAVCVFARSQRQLLKNDVRDLALFNTSVDSMLRGSDLLQLKVEDVMDDDGAVIEEGTTRQSKTKAGVDFVLTRPAREALEHWILVSGKRSGDYLFTSTRKNTAGKPLSTAQYRRLVKNWAKRAGLDPKRFSGHSTRRTKSSVIYDATQNLAAIQQLLGHKSIASTALYLGVEKRQALNLAKKTEI